jgi:hypothetical protein
VLVQPGPGAVVVDELEVGGVPADRILGGVWELVARIHGREQLGEVPVRLREVHQLRDDVPQRVDVRTRRQQCGLGPGVAQHRLARGVSFARVGVEQRVGCIPAYDGGQLPAEVRRVQQADVQTLTAARRMHVRGIARQQHPAAPVGVGLTGVVAEPACVVQFLDDDRGAGDPSDRVGELGGGHRTARFGACREFGNAGHVAAAQEGAGVVAPPGRNVAGETHPPRDRPQQRRGAGKAEPGERAHRAATAVAADQVSRAQP